MNRRISTIQRRPTHLKGRPQATPSSEPSRAPGLRTQPDGSTGQDALQMGLCGVVLLIQLIYARMHCESPTQAGRIQPSLATKDNRDCSTYVHRQSPTDLVRSRDVFGENDRLRLSKPCGLRFLDVRSTSKSNGYRKGKYPRPKISSTTVAPRRRDESPIRHSKATRGYARQHGIGLLILPTGLSLSMSVEA